MENRTSEAQIKAINNWVKKNPEKNNKNRGRSATRVYIRKYADLEDLKEIESWIEDKKEVLKKIRARFNSRSYFMSP